MADYYQVLGVTKNASSEEIKKAYHKLAHQHHPDKGGGDEKKFKEINEAYQILSDKEKRAQYDRLGRTFEGGGPGFAGVWPDFDFSRFSGASGGIEFDLGEMMEEFFGGGGFRQPDLRKGQDIQVDIEIPLEATLEGLTKKINLKKPVVCSRCHGNGAEPGTKIKKCFSCGGTGRVQQIKKTVFGSITRVITCPECKGEGQSPEKPCNVCRGEGRISEQAEIEIFIPAGVDSNQVIRIKNQGEAGRRGGESGDLFVRVFVRPHQAFIRRGDDLYLEKEISFSQAALGDELKIDTLDNKKISLKVPAGTQSGKFFRLSGKGIPHFSSLGRGNLYVKIKIITPTRLTQKQKESLENLKKEGI